MQPNTLKEPAAKAPWAVIHPLSEQDSVGAAALRSAVAPMKGKVEGTAGRGLFNDIMERVAVPDCVTFEAATVGGITGWWVKPARAQKGSAIIHVHGGWFTWGTAKAFRNFVGHIAWSAGADAFIPDYRLAPEHPFPAAVRDLEACYRGLVDQGITKVALTGDSAGGNLALVLLSIASARATKDAMPRGLLRPTLARLVVEVDARQVTGVDEAGRKLLSTMHQAGARLIAEGVAMTALIEEITAKHPFTGSK